MTWLVTLEYLHLHQHIDHTKKQHDLVQIIEDSHAILDPKEHDIAQRLIMDLYLKERSLRGWFNSDHTYVMVGHALRLPLSRTIFLEEEVYLDNGSLDDMHRRVALADVHQPMIEKIQRKSKKLNNFMYSVLPLESKTPISFIRECNVINNIAGHLIDS
mmetsp:Transcript_22839/g.17292  ORF Transcript_22839/g.17292 Transcript_22839/m.17292 type:complete len:159 (+) Transcript_22839:1407-1883(+)